LFSSGQIGQRQLGVDDFDVGNRIHAPSHVNDVLVLEAPHNIHNGVCLADIGQKLVSQTLTLGGTRNQTRNIDKLNHSRQDALGFDDLGQRRQTRVGHLYHTNVRLDSAKRVVLGCDSRLGKRVEQS